MGPIDFVRPVDDFSPFNTRPAVAAAAAAAGGTQKKGKGKEKTSEKRRVVYRSDDVIGTVEEYSAPS